MSPSTNSIGRGKKNLTVTVTVQECEAIEALAQRSGMSRNEYCLHILQSAIEAAPEFANNTEIHIPTTEELPETLRQVISRARRRTKSG